MSDMDIFNCMSMVVMFKLSRDEIKRVYYKASQKIFSCTTCFSTLNLSLLTELKVR